MSGQSGQTSTESNRADRIVKLNVGGVRYETRVSSLLSIPNTLLSNMFGDANAALLTEQDEYFFDRNGRLFEYVLDMYRNGGNLILPSVDDDAVESERIMQEFRYWGISLPSSPKVDINDSRLVHVDKDPAIPSECNLLLVGDDAARFFTLLSVVSQCSDNVPLCVGVEAVRINAFVLDTMATVRVNIPRQCFDMSSRWPTKRLDCTMYDCELMKRNYCNRDRDIVAGRLVISREWMHVYILFDDGFAMHDQRPISRSHIDEARLPLYEAASAKPSTAAFDIADNALLIDILSIDGVDEILRLVYDEATSTLTCFRKQRQGFKSASLKVANSLVGGGSSCVFFMSRRNILPIVQRVGAHFCLRIEIDQQLDGYYPFVYYRYSYDSQPADFQFVFIMRC